MHCETDGKRSKICCHNWSRSRWVTLYYLRGKPISSCGFDGIIVLDGMAFVLTIEAFGLFELATTVLPPLLLPGCSQLLLFMGLTILLTYLFTGFLLSLLAILPLLNLMHTHSMRGFLKMKNFKNKIKIQKQKV